MLCEICHIREATINFTQVVNLKLKEFNICKTCSEEKGLTNPLDSLQQIFNGLLFSNNEEDKKNSESPDVYLKCNGCSLTWDEFQKDSVFGCEKCYSAFNDKIQILMRKIHGSNKHIGNRPSTLRVVENSINVDKLKSELKEALVDENYEKAAELRDRIRDIEAHVK